MCPYTILLQGAFYNEKKLPETGQLFKIIAGNLDYLIFACAAATRAIGTR